MDLDLFKNTDYDYNYLMSAINDINNKQEREATKDRLEHLIHKLAAKVNALEERLERYEDRV